MTLALFLCLYAAQQINAPGRLESSAATKIQRTGHISTYQAEAVVRRW
jgi:hypothetical protein